MCGVTPRPVDVRPLQDRVNQAVQHCGRPELSAMQDQVKALEGQLTQILQVFAGAILGGGFRGQFDNVRDGQRDSLVAPEAGCLPPPSRELSCAPAGKGLQTNPAGWPSGSVRTAGGYTIVPEGKDAAWRIFGPDQKPQDKPMTRVWGDPHVDEADGQRWDFTKSSNFRLPDGTLIDVRTTSETGQSVSAGLNIINGSDRVSIDGIEKNKPVLGELKRDGFEYRAKLATAHPNRDTFVLGGTGNAKDGNDRIQWARERGGQLEGVISGTIHNIDGKNSYGQKLDANRKFTIDASLRPDRLLNPGGWGNMLRGELADAAGRNLRGDQLTAELQKLNRTDDRARYRADAQGRLDAIGATRRDLAPWANAASNPLAELLSSAQRLFSMMFEQMDRNNTFGQNLLRNRTMFV